MLSNCAEERKFWLCSQRALLPVKVHYYHHPTLSRNNSDSFHDHYLIHLHSLPFEAIENMFSTSISWITTLVSCANNNRGGVRLGLPVHGISYPEMDSTKTFVAEQHIFHNALTFLMLIDI